LPPPSSTADQIHHHHFILAWFIAPAATSWTPLPFPPSYATSCLEVRASGQATAMGAIAAELTLAMASTLPSPSPALYSCFSFALGHSSCPSAALATLFAGASDFTVAACNHRCPHCYHS
jgi:hypothetical protein